jgi:hypothetical protein
MTERPIETAVVLPNAALPTANWADAYRLRVVAPGLTPDQAARLALGRFPRWVTILMRIRDAIVRLFGLKSTGIHDPAQMEMIGMFPVVGRSAGQIVLGFDDRHLDFRIVIDVDDDNTPAKVVSVTTLVYRKILLGRIYIAVITPFHRLIVRRMLANVGRRLAAQSIGVAV